MIKVLLEVTGYIAYDSWYLFSKYSNFQPTWADAIKDLWLKHAQHISEVAKTLPQELNATVLKRWSYLFSCQQRLPYGGLSGTFNHCFFTGIAKNCVKESTTFSWLHNISEEEESSIQLPTNKFFFSFSPLIQSLLWTASDMGDSFCFVLFCFILVFSFQGYQIRTCWIAGTNQKFKGKF